MEDVMLVNRLTYSPTSAEIHKYFQSYVKGKCYCEKCNASNRGSYMMSVYVLLNLLYKLMKRDKM